MKTRDTIGWISWSALILTVIFCISASQGIAASGPLPAGKFPADLSLLWSPGRLAVDQTGTVYVVDGYKNRVQKFDSRGTYLGSITVSRPSAVAAAPDGTVYIGSHQDYSVTKYKDGKLVGHLGDGKKEFSSIRDIGVDESTGDVYVADTAANTVRVYDSYGIPTGTLTRFTLPAAVAVTADRVYVLDAPVVPAPGGTGTITGSRISVLDKQGALVRSIDEAGKELDGMVRPVDIAVDRFGNVYVADASRKAVIVYDGAGAFIGEITSTADDLRTAVAVTLSRDGSLYVSSSETHDVVEVGLAGAVRSTPGGALDFRSRRGYRVSPVALGYY